MKHSISVLVGAFAFFCLFALTSCDLPTNPRETRLGQPFDIKVGQKLSIQGEDLDLLFRNVTDDSRCPEGAACVWEGNAKAAFDLTKDGGQETAVVLNTNRGNPDQYPHKAKFMDYEIELIQLAPYPKVGREQIKQEEYVATVVITKQ